MNLPLLVFLPEIYADSINLLLILTLIVVDLIDTALRPFPKKDRSVKEEFDKYTLLLLIVFLSSPFIFMLAYVENHVVIQQWLPIFDSVAIGVIGLIITAIGGSITIVGRYQLGKQASGFVIVDEDHELIQSGIFAYVRHPIYAGGVIGALGIGLAFQTIFTTIMYTSFLFFVLNIRLQQEEKLLLEQFGQEYEVYQKKTKKLIPFLY